MPTALAGPAIEALARVLCTYRTVAMGEPVHTEPCDVCRRQAVLMLNARWKLVRAAAPTKPHDGSRIGEGRGHGMVE